jgi:hypothetical protein
VAIVSVPRSVNEGDRFGVTVKVGAPLKARSVAVQNLQADILGNPQWITVSSRSVSGKARHTLRVVAKGLNVQRYRAVAVYRNAPKRAVSNRFSVNVWRWIDLRFFRPYYSTSGVSVHEYSQFPMNGDQWLGWYAYGNNGMWESRHTPGRNCKAFRGVFGLHDGSQDGSSATFTLVADETQTVFESSRLSPGMVQSVRLDLAKPYRLAIQARNTSPDGVQASPAIGSPQLLCTGL